MTLQISQRVLDLGEKARQGLAEQFARIDAIAEENTARVLSAFQKHRVAEGYFAGTTGYGYDDLGRDQLDQIYADLFGTEAAMVRIQFVNGTHAITCALFGALKAGDVLLSAVGAPYDTLMGAIGTADKGHGSLRDYGVEYRQVELKDDCPDLEGLARAAADPRVKAVLIQRSKGYSTRASLSVAEIGEMCRIVKEVNPGAAVLVDNCYGEFVETQEPTHVGADLVVGSLIKNPGGGLAPTGGYVAGRRDLVEGAAMRLTAPGIGGECGCTLGQNRLLYQGLFLAPHTVAQAVKTAVFAARVMELLGYETEPHSSAVRHDIIQMIHTREPEALKKFCKGIQFGICQPTLRQVLRHAPLHQAGRVVLELGLGDGHRHGPQAGLQQPHAQGGQCRSQRQGRQPAAPASAGGPPRPPAPPHPVQPLHGAPSLSAPA